MDNSYLKHGKKIFEGKILDKDFVLIISGIGKVNAAMATEVLICSYSLDFIINFGIAGGKEGCKFKAGDLVLLDKVCQYDFDLSEIDDVSIGYMQDYDRIFYPLDTNLYTGKAFKIMQGASGDRFTSQKYFLDIIKKLGASVVDMEMGAIAQVAYSANIPALSLKLISDVDGEGESIFEQYLKNLNNIHEKFFEGICELVSNLK